MNEIFFKDFLKHFGHSAVKNKKTKLKYFSVNRCLKDYGYIYASTLFFTRARSLPSIPSSIFNESAYLTYQPLSEDATTDDNYDSKGTGKKSSKSITKLLYLS